MENYLNNLKLKFNYSDDFISKLENIIDALINYYGNEYQNIILEALFNCEIHFKKSGEQYEIINAPVGGTGFFLSEPVVNNGIINAKYDIYVFDNYFHKFDLNNELDLATLVHEICHLIKGYERINVIDDKILMNSGLMFTEYDLNGNKLNNGFDINYGFEEALNCYDETQVMKRILNRDFKSNSYYEIANLSSLFMNRKDIAIAIKKAQFGDDSDLVNIFGRETLNEIFAKFDKLIGFSYNHKSDEEIEIDELTDKLIDEGKSIEEINSITESLMMDIHNKAWTIYDRTYDELEKFIINFTSKKQLGDFKNAQVIADKKILENIYNNSRSVKM